ncbi:MAG: RES family NAD+ phosphorylase [Bacteroidia bacterium]|nr:RES family NAD+ phosphorylase [Bacteroidia bacterium]
MLSYRICNSAYSRDLSGTSAKLYGGRWNPVGMALLYSSSHISLSCLELVVNIEMTIKIPDLALLTLEIPDGLKIKEIRIKDLPHDWRTYPAPFALQNIGRNWLRKRSSPILKVPSAVIPMEFNYLINPEHPESDAVAIKQVSKFELDGRLIP